MNDPKRRRYPRCVKDTAITYAFLNKTEHYDAVARNYSSHGMYFETVRSLSPGTLILLRPVGCDVVDNRETAPFYCTDIPPDSEACQALKMQVIGEVKRCDRLEEADRPRYGIGVRYVEMAA